MKTEGAWNAASGETLLLDLASRRASGRLTISNAHQAVRLTLEEGELLLGEVANQSFRDGLGRLMIEQSWLRGEDANAVDSAGVEGPRAVRDYLVSRARVSASEFNNGMRLFVTECVERALGIEGSFHFEEGAGRGAGGFAPLMVQEALLRAAQESGEGAFAASRELAEGFFASSTEERDVRVMGRDQPAEGDKAIWVTPDEAGLLEELSGVEPASQAAARLKLDAFRFRCAMGRLRRLGLIEAWSPGEAAAIAAEPPSMRSEDPINFSDPLFSGPDDVSATRRTAVLPPEGGGPLVPPELGGKRSTWRNRKQAADSWGDAARWFVTGMALLFLIVTLATAYSDGIRWRFTQPFPWQATARRGHEALQNRAIKTSLHKAITAYHVVYGQYPQDLHTLVDDYLLTGADLLDARGDLLRIEPRDNGYVLRSRSDADSDGRVFQRFNRVGDTFLDPGFSFEAEKLEQEPLVVLD